MKLRVMGSAQALWRFTAPRRFARATAAPVAPLLNDQLLRHRAVRLISARGDDCGVMSGVDAVARARAEGLDLMQVSVGKDGAVAKLVDYDAFAEERRKKEYGARKRKKESQRLDKKEGALKNVRLSPTIDTHDLAMKMRQAQQFLREGYRVRVYMQFRRGHGRLGDNAKVTLVNAAQRLSEFGKIQGLPQGGGIADLFAAPPKEEGGEEPPDAPQKRKPLQVLIQPLSRKLREQFTDGLPGVKLQTEPREPEAQLEYRVTESPDTATTDGVASNSSTAGVVAIK